jgi:hypothetical protein
MYEAATDGMESAMSMRLWGSIQGEKPLILLYSCSSHTFLSHRVAARLSGITPMVKPFGVKVGNGTQLICGTQLFSAKW